MKGSIVTAVIAVAVIATSSIIVLSMLKPALQRGQEQSKLFTAKQMLLTIDGIIRELAFEAPGATRSVRVVAEDGTFIVAGKEDKLKFRLEPQTEVLPAGTSLQEGNLLMTAGTGMRAYESDINSDGTTDLVLENDAALFAVRKVGTTADWAPLNLTSIISRIGNKRTNINVTPITGIFINDVPASTYGTGYTELTASGSGIASAGIRIYMNSSSGTVYEALFTMQSSMDFVELEVRNVRSA